jgi:hypothetical protein
MEAIMKNLVFGILLGSCLTTGLGLAQNYYDSNGALSAPRGSQQQYDYYRQRELYTDMNAVRRENDRMRLRELENPCAK